MEMVQTDNVSKYDWISEFRIAIYKLKYQISVYADIVQIAQN